MPESAAAVAASAVCMCDAGDFLGVAYPPPQVQCTYIVGRQVVHEVPWISKNWFGLNFQWPKKE